MHSTGLVISHKVVTRILSDLVRINSVNPSLSPEGPGENEIGIYIADILSSIGLDVTTYPLARNRMNVVGVLRGKNTEKRGRSLLLNAHMDTVGVEGMVGDPFGAEVRDGLLYGRGAQDMKGSLAAMITAAQALQESGIELGGDLLITAVADEEHASIGTENLVREVTADAAIVTEPTDLTICRAHRGFIWYDVETFGRAAHGSRFEEGVDANMRMGRFLSKLQILEQTLRKREPHPLAGPPSLHAAHLKGGSEISIYAAHCLLQIERRTSPGETVLQATTELQSILDALVEEDPSYEAKLTTRFSREPFQIHKDADIVKVLDNVYTKRFGGSPSHTGQTFWTDAALLSDAGIETVLIGPVGGGLHSAEEWVSLESVVDLAYILAETATQYCA